jgi:UDP-N-acetylmuramoyl-tripeptide--D-alanyl-D-alanine ligase
MRPFFTLPEVEAALGVTSTDRPGVALSSIVTDSRKDCNGALFLALKGENFDGHAFLEAAATAGAAALCVERGTVSPELKTRLTIPVLEVDDTLLAYQQLALAHRRRFPDLKVIALTGSSGKTSTKEMIAAVLEAGFPGAVLKTEGNTNNHFGVPRNLFRLGPQHRAAVIEMGTNHPGEIAALVRLAAPRIGVICNIGHAHLEYLGDLAGVAREKGALFAGLEALDGGEKTAIYPAAAPHAEILQNLAGKARTFTVGTDPGTAIRVAYLGAAGGGQYGVRLTWTATDETREIRWSLGGAHQALNAGCAAAVGTALGIPPDAIAAGLAACVLPGMRMDVRETDGVHWVNDAYNSNPDSARAGVTWFHEITAKADPAACVLVLGDMRELGPAHAPQAHTDLLRFALDTCPGCRILPVGEQMQAAARDCGLRAYPDALAARTDLHAMLAPGAWVLLKGSRGIQLEKLLPAALAPKAH